MKATINIDNYLSEEEKKELAIEVFKNQIKKELFKSIDGTVQSDSEIQRIIANISHVVVIQELKNYIPSYEDMIKQKVKKMLMESDFKYELFKKKDSWDFEESLAITYMRDAVKDCKEIFQKRIKETIENYDISKQISTEISDTFGEMADTIYKLSDLFHKKSL